MRTFVSIALGVALGAGLLLASREARACSCGYAELPLISPRGGATGVPPDTLLWFGVTEEFSPPCADGAPRLRLLDEHGAPVPATESELFDGARTAIVLTPTSELVPGASYAWSHCLLGEVRTFTVAAAAAAAAPPVPLLSVAGFRAFEETGSSCDLEYNVVLHVQHEGLLFVIDTDGSSTATDGPPTGNVSRLGVETGTTVGDGNCETGWEGLARGVSGQLRAGVYGANGRFSGWSGPIAVTYPEKPEPPAEDGGCAGDSGPPQGQEGDDEGCAAAPGRPGGALASGCCLVALLLRRKRCRRYAAPMRALVASLVLFLAGCVGPAGRNSLVRIDRCAESGARLFAGVDDDGDGVLAPAEVDGIADLECREPPPGEAVLPPCRKHADCAALPGYCASDSRCHPVAPLGTCEAARNAPPRHPHGPILFDPGQDSVGVAGRLCTRDPACPNAGNVCQFSFEWSDPERDVEAKRALLYQKLAVYRGALPAGLAHDVARVEGNSVAFTVCVDENTRDVAFAAQLLDDAGHPSNTLCFEGTAPWRPRASRLIRSTRGPAVRG